MAENGQNTTGLYMIDPAVVDRAMRGDEAAFREIYDKTYRNNLYVARKYMKNDAVAEDVLQEAYIRIWTNLPGLKSPAGFVNWSRQIVANTALNELRKHQPMLFSEINGDDGSAMELQIEDVYPANQPELAFTEREEQEIIHEMINSLSDEQRMCVMMYYIENLSVREIAQAMGCSEGTVKSRLNYGRQNIKAKAEDLQRKGYNFKGISALAILVLLLVRESRRFGAGMVVVSAAPVTAAAPMAATSMNAQPMNVRPMSAQPMNVQPMNVRPMNAQPMSAQQMNAASMNGVPGAATRMNQVVSAGNASGRQMPAGAARAARKAAPASGKSTAAKAVKGGFLKTTAGKLLIGGISLFAVAGIVVGVVLATRDKKTSSSSSGYSANAGTDTTSAPWITSTESSTREAVTSEAKTEAVTEAVTEDPAESYAYADEYQKILEENAAGIRTYEQTEYYDGNERSVAIINTLGDENPELFFITQDARNLPPTLHVYTIFDGKAALLKEEADFVGVSGGSCKHALYASKSGAAFYDVYAGKNGKDSFGDNEKLTLNGTRLEEAEMTDADRADQGDIILAVAVAETIEKEPIGTSYEDAVEALKKLQGDAKEPSDEKENAAGQDVQALGDTFLKDLAATVVRVSETQEPKETADFDKKYFPNGGSIAPVGLNLYRIEQIHYAYYDLDQDGMDELLISGGPFAVVSFKSGKPVIIAVACSERETLSYLQNGHIVECVYEDAGEHSFTEYEIDPSDTKLKELRHELVRNEDMDKFTKELGPEVELELKELSDFR